MQHACFQQKFQPLLSFQCLLLDLLSELTGYLSDDSYTPKDLLIFNNNEISYEVYKIIWGSKLSQG